MQISEKYVKIENQMKMVDEMTTQLNTKETKLREIVTALEKVEKDLTDEISNSIQRR